MIKVYLGALMKLPLNLENKDMLNYTVVSVSVIPQIYSYGYWRKEREHLIRNIGKGLRLALINGLCFDELYKSRKH